MKKYEAVASAIINEIGNNHLPDGTPLPTEEQLTKKYNVSRQTVRKALSVLAERKLIVKKQGSGSVVKRAATPVKNGKIAVITTYIDDYIFPVQLRGVEEVLSENNYSAVLSATQNRICDERRILENLLEDLPEGILVEGTKTAFSNPNADLYAKLMVMGVPIVFFNSYYPELKGMLSVCADNEGGGRELAAYLLEKGHRSISAVFKADDIQGHQRYRGFITALYESGNIISDDRIIWYTTETKDDLLCCSDKLLSAIGDSTAMVCYNDEIAFNLIKRLAAAGKRVPDDVAVVSFDNSSLSDLSAVAITSLSCNDNNIGAAAARKLMDMLQGKAVSSEIIPWKLIVKESS